MATETHDPMLPQTETGTTMAGVVREAWLATAELDEVVDSDTRQSAFVLVLEAMLRDGELGTPVASVVEADTSDASYEIVEQDDLVSHPGTSHRRYFLLSRDQGRTGSVCCVPSSRLNRSFR